MKKLYLILLFCIATLSGMAQDIHFSQYYNSPLTINPALTGKEDADWRGNLNYRSQWLLAKNTRGISTFAASGDGRVLTDALPKYDRLGVGIQLFHDTAGDGKYNTTSIAPSIAYHKSLGYNNKIAVGLQPGFSNTSIDFSKLYFENQYIGIGFDRNLPTGEPVVADNVGYFDLGGGFLYSFRSSSETWSAYLGGAMFHINAPTINFLSGATYKRPSRAVLNGGLTAQLKNNFVLSPSFLYMNQAGANELTIGTILGRSIGNPRIVGASKSVYGGLFWRKGDAIIGKVGMQMNDLQIGLSSDFAASDINKPVGFNTGLELSLTILGGKDDDQKPIFCPSF